MIGFRSGSSAGGSSGGIDFDSDYFNVPLIALNKIVPKTDYSPPPVTGDDNVEMSSSDLMVIPGVNAPAVPYTPVVPSIPGGMGGATSEAATFLPGAQNTEGTGYFQKPTLTDADIDQYLTEASQFAYNPATNQMEAYNYPLNTIAPGYADAQSKFVMGTQPGMSGEELKNIAQNAQDVQKTTLEIAQNNPTADAFQIAEALHTAQTGFDSAGNFVGNADNPINNDPVTQAFNSVPDYSQPTQSVFEPGGAFSGGGKQ